MKKITMITAQDCAYCKKAKNLLERIYRLKPEYAFDRIDIIDVKEAEKRNMRGKSLPCFFIGDKKVYEGYVTKDKMLEIFDAANEDKIIPFSREE